MVSFYVYDLTFLVLFTLWVVYFLYKRRKNLGREMGIMFLYRTQVGVKFIDWFAKKYSRILHGLKYVVITSGYVLMVIILWMIGKSFYTYVKYPQITQIIKAPPVAPLIPYFPKLFGLESFFPPLYFTYFILALAIVAIVHEFSHGIFMRLFNIKIKSTGFAFLGPILGAFVEQDQKQMIQKKKSEQMTVLAAGTFANLVFAILFWLLLMGFFYASFAPAGAQFTTYSQAIIPVTMVNGFSEPFGENNLVEVSVENETYLADENLLEQLNSNATLALVYHNAPAVKIGLDNVIIKIDDTKIKSRDDLANYLGDKKPGDEIKITTLVDGEDKEYEVVLAGHPLEKEKGYLGIAFSSEEGEGVVGKFISVFMGFRKQSTYYEPRWDGEFVEFIYNLLWWIMIINFLVALFNMLPLGILDGGQFFYLTILSIGGSKRFAKIFFRILTYLILILFFLMMFFWFIRIF